ncbi:alpha/beta hydrolase [Tsuneonella sp. CC-YZS046]|uniref:alpha/beta hydrolase n=1 Tax=Tsuneonella sp. CC-YZS046 TaxID=3042152 RepID=UPI002D77443E|nr:alpha/beta hydrolase [Tsuneonella sp. CC-YZS046]WRO67237.1 alpha/beta hydrolase [Tsuneonella sp. CC-YZS046]
MADGALAKVAPDLRRFIELLPDLSDIAGRLAEIRGVLDGEPPSLGDDGEAVTSEIFIDRPDGTQLRCLFCRPSAVSSDRPLPVLLHVHGGGYVAGSANRDHDIVRKAVIALGCAALIPDYRLAPEYPYPEPLDDVLLSYRWLREQAAALAIDADRIALRGVSAGGGLAYAATLKLREDPASAPCFLLLVFPMLDDRTEPHPHNGVYVWTHDNNQFGWDSYLAKVDRSDPPPFAVPGRVEDVSGLPPIFMTTGAIDLFAGENLDLARRLVDGGIALEMHVYPGAYHGFALIPCEATQAYEQAAMAALTRAFAAKIDGE